LPALLGLGAPANLQITLDYTLRNVILGASILGIVGGALGSFAVLRRQSLLSDALAHAALPGIALMFMLTGTKTPELLLLGAAISGWIGTVVLLGIVRGTRVKEDAALGIVLTVFFGFGILLLTRIQHSDRANQSGLDRYLFGQAATLMERDVLVMALLAALALGLLVLFYKEFKLLAFDRAYAASLGYPTTLLDVLLTSLIVLAVLIGLQTVGVVLMVAMLIAPAAAARQWTHHLGRMIVLSAAFGATAGTIGAIASSVAIRTPTGPVIVLVATGIFIVSLLVAPQRGLLWSWLHQRRQRQRIALAHALAEIHAAVAHQTGRGAGAAGLARATFAPDEVAAQRGHTVGDVRRDIAALARRGLVAARPDGRYSLTPAGAAEAVRAARNQRLWQAYLAHQLDLPAQDVHLDFADLERTLSPEALAQLDALARGGEAERSASAEEERP
jgi:manganese/zinc/iron transport system permease protein